MQAEHGSGYDLCGIGDTQLDARDALIVVETEISGDVERPVVGARTEDGLADRGAGAAESNGFEAGTVVGNEGKADVAAGADDVGELHPVRGEGEDRLRIAGAEWPCPLDVLDEGHIGTAGA